MEAIGSSETPVDFQQTTCCYIPEDSTVSTYSTKVVNVSAKQINKLHRSKGAYLKRLVAGFPLRRLGFDPGSGQVGFVVDKVALGHVSSEYFGFPAYLRSTNCSTITLTYHLGLVQ
jgi:hypothetical protein